MTTDQKTVAWAEFLGGEKARKIVQDGQRRRELEKRIDMHELEEDLGDSPDWGEWSCSYLKPDGTWSEGTIQGDRHTMVLESLRDENGNPFDIFYP